MKKVIILVCTATFISCTVSKKSVRKTVAIEKNCELENVKIIEREKGMGRATYKLDACGETYIYKVIGSTISEGGANINY